jgi:predicted DNA-binding transcriptional regulator AlpA
MVDTPTPAAAATAAGGVLELDGRPVYTRGHLIERHGLGLSTLEALYREREQTGHPEAVGAIGRAKVWDAQAWDTWWGGYIDTTGLLTFDDLAHRRGVSRATVATWWRDRADNGFPAPVKKFGNALYFEAAALEQWDDPRTACRDGDPDPGDRDGHPDDEVTLAEAERICGVPKGSFTTYFRRPPRHWPAPVRTESLPSGRERRIWRRGDIWTYDDLRGRHGGGRPAGPSQPRRYPYDGDPRLDIARTALQDTPAAQHPGLPTRLATDHGGAPGTWGAILTTARQHPTPDGA